MTIAVSGGAKSDDLRGEPVKDEEGLYLCSEKGCEQQRFQRKCEWRLVEVCKV